MIFYETRGQAEAFLLLLYAGFASAALYDLLRFPRRYLPKALAPALDLLWCLFAGAACALALSFGGEGRARLYALLGFLCGGGLYALGVRALILGIARSLKIPVIAEGVETETQLRLLKEMGCELVQGYYFSRPLPAPEFEGILEKAVFGG